MTPYEWAHEKLRKHRGPARDYACVDCGQPADHWSYDYQDPDAGFVVSHGARVGEFSLDVAHYQPRCRQCHARFDTEHHRSGGRYGPDTCTCGRPAYVRGLCTTHYQLSRKPRLSS